MTLARKIEGRNHQCGDCAQDDVIRQQQIRGTNAMGARRCLRTHPSTVTAGLLPLGPDPVRLDPPRLETAFRPRLIWRKTQGTDYSTDHRHCKRLGLRLRISSTTSLRLNTSGALTIINRWLRFASAACRKNHCDRGRHAIRSSNSPASVANDVRDASTDGPE